MQQTQKNLIEKFDSILLATRGGKIQNARINNTNELYFEIAKENIIEIAYYIYEVLNYPLVTIIATDERKVSKIYAIRHVFSNDKDNQYIVLKIKIQENDPSFLSITPHIHEASWYEREIKDMFGLIPTGHPDPKRIVMHENWPADIYPLRKDFSQDTRVPVAHEIYNFYRMEGEGVFEIAVGPVHAGIIEPGHFRFSVAGEEIILLEAKLGYTHKGIEKLFEGRNYSEAIKLSERVSGDSSFAHSLAFSLAAEKISGAAITGPAAYIRGIFLELERMYNHVNDIGGMALDVGFSFPAAYASIIKEVILRLNEKLTMHRYLKGVNLAGGVSANIDEDANKIILDSIAKIKTYAGAINVAENEVDIIKTDRQSLTIVRRDYLS